MLIGAGIGIPFQQNVLARLLGSAEFFAPLTHSAIPTRAASGTTATFTRATTATVTDNEGVLRTAIAGEARFEGARRVRNVMRKSEDFSGAEFTKTNCTVGKNLEGPDGVANSACTVTATGASALLYDTLGITPASCTKAVTSVYLKRITGTGTVQISANGANTNVTVALTTSWQRFAASATTLVSGTFPAILIATSGDAIGVAFWQEEDITGRTDQTTPSEYVSVGVESAPYYHGSFVDGVKCFPTDLSGNPIPSTTMLGYVAEGARTNVLLRSEEFDNATWSKSSSGVASVPVVTANQAVAPNGTLTADKIVMTLNGGTASGDVSQIYQAPSTGAGTYTGSLWLKGEVGGEVVLLRHVAGADYTQMTLTTEWKRFSATEVRAANNFELTLRGSFGSSNAVTIYAWGAQLELGSFASSYIATTTAAVTRDADVLTYSSAGNIDGTVGWCYAEVTSSAPNSEQAIYLAGTGAGGYVAYHDSDGALKLFDAAAARSLIAEPHPVSIPTNFAVSWGGSSSQGSVNGAVGSAQGFDGGISLAGADLGVGGNAAGIGQIFGTIRNVRIGQRQLSSSELQAVTR